MSNPLSVNFTFLQKHDPTLLQAAALAEKYVFDDPNTALFKIRQLAELLAKRVAAKVGLPCGREDSFADVVYALRSIRPNVIPKLSRWKTIIRNPAVRGRSS